MEFLQVTWTLKSSAVDVIVYFHHHPMPLKFRCISVLQAFYLGPILMVASRDWGWTIPNVRVSLWLEACTVLDSAMPFPAFNHISNSVMRSSPVSDYCCKLLSTVAQRSCTSHYEVFPLLFPTRPNALASRLKSINRWFPDIFLSKVVSVILTSSQQLDSITFSWVLIVATMKCSYAVAAEEVAGLVYLLMHVLWAVWHCT